MRPMSTFVSILGIDVDTSHQLSAGKSNWNVDTKSRVFYEARFGIRISDLGQQRRGTVTTPAIFHGSSDGSC